MYAAIAQSVERILGKDEVTSSNLVSSSKKHQFFWCFFFCFKRQEMKDVGEGYVEKIKWAMNQPLKPQDSLFILIGIFLLFFFIIWADGWYRTHKNRQLSQKFRKEYPHAALVYLFLENQPVEKGTVHCINGMISPLFLISAKEHPHKYKGLAFYALPGELTIQCMVPVKKRGKKKIITTAPASFSVETDASYEMQIHLTGWLKVNMLKGYEIPVVVQEPVQKVVHTVEHRLKTPIFTDIVANYRIQELKRLVFAIVLLYSLLGSQVWLTNLPKYVLLIPFVLCLFVLIKMITVGTKQFYHIENILSERVKEQIQIQFQNPHPIYSLFSGEVHLLKNCLICRQGGILHLILLDQIGSVYDLAYAGTYGTVKTMVIEMKNGKRYKLEFFGRHKKELSLVQAWIQKYNPNIMVQ